MDGSSSRDNRYCSNCGERITRDANYCYYCGETLSAGAQRSPEIGPQGGRGTQPRQSHAESHQPTQAEPGAQPGARPREATGEEAVRVPDQSDRPAENPLRTVLVGTTLGLGGLLSAFLLTSIGVLFVRPFSSPLQEILLVGLITFQFAWFGVFAIGYLRSRGLDWATIRAYIGVKLPSLKDIGLILVTWLVMIIAAAVVAQVVMLAVSELVGSGAAEEGPAENPVGDVVKQNPAIFPGAVLFMFLVVGPSEEILFRGIVQGRLRERLSPVPAILIASAVFASAHVLALWGQPPVAIAMTITILFVPSLGFGAIYEYTGNIVVPALLHGFHNSVVITLVLFGAQAQASETLVWLAAGL